MESARPKSSQVRTPTSSETFPGLGKTKRGERKQRYIHTANDKLELETYFYAFSSPFSFSQRTLDNMAKEKAKEFTGKDTYEFGDISKALDKMAKDQGETPV